MRIYDISVPQSPAELSEHDIPGATRGIAISGDYCYTATDERFGLHVIDVTNASTPETVGACGIMGNAIDVELVNDHAYVLESKSYGEASLRLFDVSDPQSPTPIGYCYAEDDANALDVEGSYAYIAGDLYDLTIIDVQDAAAPTLLSSTMDYGNAEDIAVAGTHAFFAQSFKGLRIVDVSDPENPEEVTEHELSESVHDIALYGDYAVLTASYDGILYIVDISDVENPVEVGSLQFEFSIEDVAVFGGYAYVSPGYSDYGFIVVDISDPTSPDVARYYTHYAQADDIVVVDDHAFFASSLGLRVVNLVDLNDLREVGYYIGDESIRALAVVGNLAYAAQGPRFGIYDCGNATPVLLQSFIATSIQDGVLVEWRTASEQNIAAFNLHRRPTQEGSTIRVNDRAIVPGQSNYRFIDRDVAQETEYTYTLASVDSEGNEALVGKLEVKTTYVPTALSLRPSMPNPFNPRTILSFDVAAKGIVRLDMFDAAGRHVRQLANRVFLPGLHQVAWDGRDDLNRTLGSGKYFVRLSSGGESLAGQVLMIR